MKKSIRLNPVVISVLIILIGLLAYWIGIPFLDLMELKTIDLRFASRGKIQPSGDVVLAVIDEKSIDREGKWIWPRSKMVELVNRLSDAGARVIAFDIGFLEPDDRRTLHMIDEIRRKSRMFGHRQKDFEQFLDQLKARSDSDVMLARAIAASRAKVVLGYFFHMEPTGAGSPADDEKRIRGSGYQLVRYSSEIAERFPFIEAAAPEPNIPEISEATAHAGFFNMIPDTDGVVRRIPAVIKFRDALYAPLSLKTVGAYLQKPLGLHVTDQGVASVRIGELRIPTDELGRVFIHYHGGVKTFPHISITDIIRGGISPDRVRDKIVMVGATAVGIYDLRVTPFGSVFPGLEIHANVVESVLKRKFMFQPAWAAVFDILAVIAAGLIIGAALSRTGAIPGAAAAVLLFAGHILLCRYLFVTRGWILNMVYPLSVILLAYAGITGYKYLAESRQKKFIREAFSTYLAPTVVKQLIETPENLNLGGEERMITAFFSDVEGFTGISEKLNPGELVELLNEFLTEMTDIILAREGTVDKFEGDAIIAFFGAPNPIANHAEVACMTGIDMQKRLKELRAQWKAAGKPELKMRIGLCTGPAVVGNMGSKNRMDYTMMGDTVNIAARLEGVNKVYGTYTLISGTTYREAHERILAREIDAINVVGKGEPVMIYEPLCYREEADPRTIQIADGYARGLDAYRNRDWRTAMDLFKAVLKIMPADGPSRTLYLRCKRFLEQPPDEKWDGTFTIRSK